MHGAAERQQTGWQPEHVLPRLFTWGMAQAPWERLNVRVSGIWLRQQFTNVAYSSGLCFARCGFEGASSIRKQQTTIKFQEGERRVALEYRRVPKRGMFCKRCISVCVSACAVNAKVCEYSGTSTPFVFAIFGVDAAIGGVLRAPFK